MQAFKHTNMSSGHESVSCICRNPNVHRNGFPAPLASSAAAPSCLFLHRLAECVSALQAGSLLEFSREGVLSRQSLAARAPGTTVALKNLFSPLPVRHKVSAVAASQTQGQCMAASQTQGPSSSSGWLCAAKRLRARASTLLTCDWPALLSPLRSFSATSSVSSPSWWASCRPTP